jgi:nicotinate-nucleotide adenylyltransferase
VKVGVFGGTFDPPHLGHLIVAQDAWQALGLDRILFVPAGLPPHKQGVPTTPAPLRLEMTRAAVAEDARFEVADLELRRAGPSFTVDTLTELLERAPDSALFLLLGADQVRELATWHRPDEILRLARVVAITRAGEEGGAGGAGGAGGGGDAGSAPELGVEVVRATRIDISATEVRRRVAAGESIRYLVPEAVERIIRRERLYERLAPS